MASVGILGLVLLDFCFIIAVLFMGRVRGSYWFILLGHILGGICGGGLWISMYL